MYKINSTTCVGTFGAVMNRIDALGLRDILRYRTLEDSIPFWGICLGMQLLVDTRNEGQAKGLSKM